MSNILCFVSQDMADFEVTLVLQILKSIGQREVITAGYHLTPVVSQSGFTHLPNRTLTDALDLSEVEALIIPGGPIRPQGDDLTKLIRRIHGEEKLLAAICFGPQYLGRAGILDHHHFTTSCSEEMIRSLGVPDPYPRRNYIDERVVRDGPVITAKGGAFVDFAFAVADYLGVYSGQNEAKESFYREITDRSGGHA